eukprot:1186967-Prorocentrum_minimum.AAC.3
MRLVPALGMCSLLSCDWPLTPITLSSSVNLGKVKAPSSQLSTRRGRSLMWQTTELTGWGASALRRSTGTYIANLGSLKSTSNTWYTLDVRLPTCPKTPEEEKRLLLHTLSGEPRREPRSAASPTAAIALLARSTEGRRAIRRASDPTGAPKRSCSRAPRIATSLSACRARGSRVPLFLRALSPLPLPLPLP